MKNFFLKNIKSNFIADDKDHLLITQLFFIKAFPTLKLDSFLETEEDVTQKISVVGETILSFNTIAGSILRLSSFNGNLPNDLDEPFFDGGENRLALILNTENNVPNSIKELITEYHDLYHSFANFMPFPATERNAINYVKASKYHDFPENFLQDYREFFFENKSNANFAKIIKTSNTNNFFNSFSSWSDFVEELCLQPFFEDDNYLISKKIMPKLEKYDFDFPYKTNSYIKLINQNKDSSLLKQYKDECSKEINYFLVEAIKIIKHRSYLLKEKNISF